MPDRPNFPIPDNIYAEPVCLQIMIPNDPTWKAVFNGLFAELTYWFNWQRDEDKSGTLCAHYWTDLYRQIDWSDMSCCCDQPPAIYRYDDDGIYQRSTDGGITWVNAPEYDYRNISTIFPPPAALGFTNTKCQNADSAVVILNEDVIQGLDNGSAVQAILEFIAAVLIFYLSAGTLSSIAIGLFSMAAAIFGFGVASTKAAFTSTVLDQLRCSIFCAMDSDDSIDDAGFTTLLSDINTHYTGIVKTSLYSIISSAGRVGVTNMLRANRGDAAADCSSCCPDCSTTWDVMDGSHGIIISRGAGYVDLQAQAVGGNYYGIISTSDPALCCVIPLIEYASGSATLVGWTDCGTTPVIGVPQHVGVFSFGIDCVDYFQLQDANPFTVRVHFAPC
jgi:hypothetical protein